MHWHIELQIAFPFEFLYTYASIVGRQTYRSWFCEGWSTVREQQHSRFCEGWSTVWEQQHSWFCSALRSGAGNRRTAAPRHYETAGLTRVPNYSRCVWFRPPLSYQYIGSGESLTWSVEFRNQMKVIRVLDASVNLRWLTSVLELELVRVRIRMTDLFSGFR